MARKKSNRSKPSVEITKASAALREVMKQNLTDIAEVIVAQIMKNLRNLPNADRFTAIKNLNQVGALAYKADLKVAFAQIAADAIANVKADVPKAKPKRFAEMHERLLLSDFDALPPGVKKRILQQTDLLASTQVDDLEKQIAFQFNHSIDSTDSDSLIEDDLATAADDWIAGSAVAAGAATLAAQVVNNTRSDFFDDPEVQSQLDAFEFVNADPVSEICTDLAGTIFAPDDPDRYRYTPPLHFNCKSYIAPILSGDLGDRDITKLKPSSKEIEDTIQFSDEICACGGKHSETMSPRK